MIKIKIHEIDKHRNETTFRPLINIKNLFNQIGIEFVYEGKADFSFIGQASIINKKVSLEESVNNGLKFLNDISEPYFIFDGQDGATLIGTYEVFINSNAINMFKICLYKDKKMYNNFYVNGRSYWGHGNYKIQNDEEKINKILLSHTNWLSTITPNWYTYDQNKFYDVSALFSANLKDVYEHGINQSIYYNSHRQQLLNELDYNKYNIIRLKNGIKYSLEEYYKLMYNSKIILSPFGFGELPPRDLESCMFGSVLIRPDVSHIDTLPNIYVPNETYIPCKHDFSDVNEKIDYVLSDYKNIQSYFVENMRKKYIESFNPEKIIFYYYEYFKKLLNL